MILKLNTNKLETQKMFRKNCFPSPFIGLCIDILRLEVFCYNLEIEFMCKGNRLRTYLDILIAEQVNHKNILLATLKICEKIQPNSKITKRIFS